MEVCRHLLPCTVKKLADTGKDGGVLCLGLQLAQVVDHVGDVGRWRRRPNTHIFRIMAFLK
jgi:hypothetical protein